MEKNLQLKYKRSKHLVHLVHFFKNLKKTGAIAPSSKFLAKDMVTPLANELADSNRKSLNILEIGPGTGPLTKQIVQYLRPDDHLDIVEINKHFHELIEKKYQAPNIDIYHSDILEFQPALKYDFIFSSLPYEALPEEISKNIWEKKLTLCNNNAYISYFKYINFKKFKCDFEREVVDRYKQDKKIVLLNLPPARCFILEVDSQQEPQMTSMVSA